MRHNLVVVRETVQVGIAGHRDRVPVIRLHSVVDAVAVRVPAVRQLGIGLRLKAQDEGRHRSRSSEFPILHDQAPLEIRHEVRGGQGGSQDARRVLADTASGRRTGQVYDEGRFRADIGLPRSPVRPERAQGRGGGGRRGVRSKGGRRRAPGRTATATSAPSIVHRHRNRGRCRLSVGDPVGLGREAVLIVRRARRVPRPRVGRGRIRGHQPPIEVELHLGNRRGGGARVRGDSPDELHRRPCRGRREVHRGVVARRDVAGRCRRLLQGPEVVRDCLDRVDPVHPTIRAPRYRIVMRACDRGCDVLLEHVVHVVADLLDAVVVRRGDFHRDRRGHGRIARRILPRHGRAEVVDVHGDLVPGLSAGRVVLRHVQDPDAISGRRPAPRIGIPDRGRDRRHQRPVDAELDFRRDVRVQDGRNGIDGPRVGGPRGGARDADREETLPRIPDVAVDPSGPVPISNARREVRALRVIDREVRQGARRDSVKLRQGDGG